MGNADSIAQNKLPSLPFGKHRVLYAVSHCITKRRKIINARFLIKSALDDFIGRLMLGNADSIAQNKLSSLPFGKRRVLYAVSHCITKRRKINNPRNLKIPAVVYFIGRLKLSSQNSVA